MRSAVRWVVVVVAVLHGLVHLLGAAEGLSWADVPQLTEPIGGLGGALWLVACVLLLATGGLLAAGVPWWWGVGLPAVFLSQGQIVASWSDAWAGTIPNVVLLVAIVHAWVSEGARADV